MAADAQIIRQFPLTKVILPHQLFNFKTLGAAYGKSQVLA
jgi:hypothetical protein